jgi:hypothetical protein
MIDQWEKQPGTMPPAALRAEIAGIMDGGRPSSASPAPQAPAAPAPALTPEQERLVSFNHAVSQMRERNRRMFPGLTPSERTAK